MSQFIQDSMFDRPISKILSSADINYNTKKYMKWYIRYKKTNTNYIKKYVTSIIWNGYEYCIEKTNQNIEGYLPQVNDGDWKYLKTYSNRIMKPKINKSFFNERKF